MTEDAQPSASPKPCNVVSTVFEMRQGTSGEQDSLVALDEEGVVRPRRWSCPLAHTNPQSAPDPRRLREVSRAYAGEIDLVSGPTSRVRHLRIAVIVLVLLVLLGALIFVPVIAVDPFPVFPFIITFIGIPVLRRSQHLI